MKKHIPNAITCCNLICGCIATHFAFTDMTPYALLFIILGAVFDFFDGFSARLLGVSSPIGKELDSLADVVTFGVAPAAMVFAMLRRTLWDDGVTLDNYTSFLPYLAFLIAAFSALRLAKFNLDTRQSHSFIGLPTPANALFWAPIAMFVTEFPFNVVRGSGNLILLALILLFCWLMVSEIPMFALKFKHYGLKGNEIRYGFLLLSVLLIAVAYRLGALLFVVPLIILLYILISVIAHLCKR